jgi:hypothetical protein
MRYCLCLALLFFGSFAYSQYKEGYLFDKYGQKFPGWLNYKNQQKVAYKESKKGKAEILGIDDVKAFTVAADSFVTIRYHDYVSDIDIEGFCKVLIKGTGQLLLKGFDIEYQMAVVSGGRSMMTPVDVPIYLIVEKERVYELSHLNFHSDMPAFIIDYKDLYKKVVSKQFTFKQIEEVLIQYESWKKSKL